MAKLAIGGKAGAGLWVEFDDDLYELFSLSSWNIDHKGYAIAQVNKVKIKMHRFVMDAKPGQIVDHTDRNTLNNRRSNLRFATDAESSRNKGLSKANTSGYKGVAKFRDKWVAAISANNAHIRIGHFDSAFKAAQAYDAYATVLHGEFAYLNGTGAGEELYKKLEIDRGKHARGAQNPTGLKGVTKVWNKWMAQATVDGTKLHFGNYDNYMDAAFAFNYAVTWLGLDRLINDLSSYKVSEQTLSRIRENVLLASNKLELRSGD